MDALSDTFFALADPTRRAILSRLSQGEAHVGELARPFGISGPAISKHLRVLERAGLIERQVDAQRRVCRVRGPALREAHRWLVEYRRFWEESLDRLAEMLEEEEGLSPAASPAVGSPGTPASNPADKSGGTNPDNTRRGRSPGHTRRRSSSRKTTHRKTRQEKS